MLWVEPGEFVMGSPGNTDDEKSHSVVLSKGYWLGKTEVTQEQWECVMGNNPSHFRNSGRNIPVEKMSWIAAMAFARS